MLTTAAFAGSYGKKEADIVDTAIAAGNFTTLAAALEAGGLVGTLKSEGPFTVFAPTDEAFAKLPEGTVEKLLNEPGRKTLKQILLYHVVPGKVTSKQVSTLDQAKTAAGSMLQVQAKDGKVMINDARVINADIPASNTIRATPAFISTPMCVHPRNLRLLIPLDASSAVQPTIASICCCKYWPSCPIAAVRS